SDQDCGTVARSSFNRLDFLTQAAAQRELVVVGEVKLTPVVDCCEQYPGFRRRWEAADGKNTAIVQRTEGFRRGSAADLGPGAETAVNPVLGQGPIQRGKNPRRVVVRLRRDNDVEVVFAR